jgi:muramoyltetrapeptide carboxypeptidase LdcA involved in peptidoglycan recycling
MFGIDQYRAVTDLLAEYGVPVIMDLDIGHLSPMMSVVCGATADVAVDGNHIEIAYTWR